MKHIILRLTPAQAEAIKSALELSWRLGMGQTAELFHHLKRLQAHHAKGPDSVVWDTVRQSVDHIREHVFGYAAGEHAGIFSDDVPALERLQHDIFVVLRKALADLKWGLADENERRAMRYWVDFDAHEARANPDHEAVEVLPDVPSTVQSASASGPSRDELLDALREGDTVWIVAGHGPYEVYAPPGAYTMCAYRGRRHVDGKDIALLHPMGMPLLEPDMEWPLDKLFLGDPAHIQRVARTDAAPTTPAIELTPAEVIFLRGVLDDRFSVSRAREGGDYLNMIISEACGGFGDEELAALERKLGCAT